MTQALNIGSLDLPAENRQNLLRMAHRRGLPSQASASPDQLLPITPRTQLLSALSATVITAAIFAGVLALVGSLL